MSLHASLHRWMLKRLAMYADYHRDGRNRATHHVGVPVIVFSLLLALNQVHLADLGPAHITAAQILLGIAIGLYLIAIPSVGVLAFVFYALVYALVVHMPEAEAWTIAAAAFVGGWVLQFIGHAFEGRRPAFLTNVTQLFVAPAFLLAEVLFACGLARGLAADLGAHAAHTVSS